MNHELRKSFKQSNYCCHRWWTQKDILKKMTGGECEPVTDRQATILGGWQNISCSTLMTMTGILDQMILGKLLTRWV